MKHLWKVYLVSSKDFASDLCGTFSICVLANNVLDAHAKALKVFARQQRVKGSREASVKHPIVTSIHHDTTLDN